MPKFEQMPGMGVPQVEGIGEGKESELSVEKQVELANEAISNMYLDGWGKVLAIVGEPRIAERTLSKLSSAEKPLSEKEKESSMDRAYGGIEYAVRVARGAHRIDAQNLPAEVKGKYQEALDKAARILEARDAWREKDPKACQEYVAQMARRLYGEDGIYAKSIGSLATSDTSVPQSKFDAYATAEELNETARKFEAILPGVTRETKRVRSSDQDLAGNYSYHDEVVDRPARAARALDRLKEVIADKAYEEAFIREHSVESQAA